MDQLTYYRDGEMEFYIEAVIPILQDHHSKFDASHDYSHIKRVLNLAKMIQDEEKKEDSPTFWRPHIITLGCLLHDVGDKKYQASGKDDITLARRILCSLPLLMHPDLPTEVQEIVNHVSYSAEITPGGKEKVQACLAAHPELAVVQDADRLDSLGEVGILRAIAFNAATLKKPIKDAVGHLKGDALKGEMEGTNAQEDAKEDVEDAAAEHAGKPFRVVGMMKTAAGRKLAEKRLETMKDSIKRHDDEVALRA